MYIEFFQDILLLLRKQGGRVGETVDCGILGEQRGGSVVCGLFTRVCVFIAHEYVEECTNAHCRMLVTVNDGGGWWMGE